MPIYDKPVRSLMKDMASAFSLENGKSFSKQQSVEWFSHNYPKIKAATVTAHLTRLSTNATSRIHYSAKPVEDDLFFQIDSSHFRLYDPKQDPAPIYKKTDTPPLSEPESPVSTEFAYESDLRDYLAKNLSLVEQGLKLYEEEGVTGVEYPVGGRFIDILALDSHGDLVVIELKVSRGYDRVVGQLLRYMGWIQKNLAEETQKVRGIIVAREITEDILLACSLLLNVDLYEYQLSLSLQKKHTGEDGL